MSVVLTESFGRFAIGAFGNLATSTIRPIQADSEWQERAFYNADDWTVNGRIHDGNDTGSTGALVGIIADPVVAVKKRLALDYANPAITKAYSYGYGLQRKFATARTKYVVGFLVRFREGDYLKNNPTATVNKGVAFEFTPPDSVRGTATANSNFRYSSVVGTNTTGIAARSVFGMGTTGIATAWGGVDTIATSHAAPPDIRIQGARDPNGSGFVLAYDRDFYCELEIDITNKTIKIWIDDVFIGNSTWNATYHATLANGFAINMFRGGALSTTNDVAGVMISDIYCVDMTDAVTPVVRLGKTTRVLGEMPDTDVAVQFTRPTGYTSNVSVINGAIASNQNPTDYLSAEGAGKEDKYRTASSTIGQFAGTVYGVTVRARFQNASSSAHEVGLTADDGTNAQTISLGTSAAGQPAQMKSAVFSVDPSGNAWTVAKAAALRYGFKIIS